MRKYIHKCIICIESAYIACTNKDWFYYVLLWSHRGVLLQSSALPAFSENDECQECSSPQLTASCNCVTATCYVNRPAFHHQYLSECLHTTVGTAAPYTTPRSYCTSTFCNFVRGVSWALTLHAGHTETLCYWELAQFVYAHLAGINNHTMWLNGLAYWQTKQRRILMEIRNMTLNDKQVSFSKTRLMSGRRLYDGMFDLKS